MATGVCMPDKPARRRAKRDISTNPLQGGILSFLARSGRKVDAPTTDAVPKRFTLYSPALFLPGNFAEHSLAWAKVYDSLDDEAKQDLFASIAETFRRSGKDVSRIAINAAIPSTIGPEDQDNRLRSPSLLQPVYGDFGPSSLHEHTGGPTQADFHAAFWLSTSQDAGIHQVWAPRWTMFSRGNIREKARILRHDDHEFPGMTEEELGAPVGEVEVLDMYVGIGYFAFSYLKSGVKRVWGWDLNPWSIEGLRRGCEKNGWRHLVVQVAENKQNLAQKQTLPTPTEHAPECLLNRSPGGDFSMTPDAETVASIIAEGDTGPATQRVRCVAFLGSNEWAAMAIHNIAARLQALSGFKGRHSTSQTCADEISPLISIRHVNLGLLPSSRDSWKTAISLTSNGLASWLHAHENANARTIHHRAVEVAKEINAIACSTKGRNWTTSCEHVEQVKSFGPGVVHCVFDIKMTPAETIVAS